MKTVALTLNQIQYNHLFSLVVVFKGAYTKIAGYKMSQLIQDAVKAGADGEKLPSTINLQVPAPILDGVFQGIIELSKGENTTAGDIRAMQEISASIKCLNRMNKYIETELAGVAESDEQFDDEVVDEPLDGEASN
jgi:hypothetical protein